jgi:TolB-like protein
VAEGGLAHVVVLLQGKETSTWRPVAQKLNVAAVIQGSVRKSGTRVRITAQLIQVATDSHLWSETYDRELDDIFAVQDDIAQSVVKALRATLLGGGTGSRHAAQRWRRCRPQ